MSKKIVSLLADETGGKPYPINKYSLDNTERPTVDYDKTTTWVKLGETETSRKGHIRLHDLAYKIANQNDPIISYFLDGSRRVFKVGDVAYSVDGSNRNTLYPVIAGQIGVGCCRRKNKTIHREMFKSEIVLSVPNIANADGKDGFFPALSQRITRSCEALGRYGLEISAVLPYGTAKDDKKLEDKGTAKVQDRMIVCEKDLVAELVRQEKLGHNDYLIKDGSLEYRPTTEDRRDSRKYKIFKNNYTWVIGLSKSFNPELCHDTSGKANPGFIADLPLHARTPVAMFDCNDKQDNPLGDIQFAVWYIRIREQKRTRSPFDGVLKVEKILIDENERLDSELIDVLSANIINERNPTCYGVDLRWANHIYPVYLTELFVKSQYISEQSFLHLF